MNLLKTLIEEAACLVALGLFLATIWVWGGILSDHRPVQPEVVIHAR